MLDQKENLIKYNKKFKESLDEKKDLKNKIEQLTVWLIFQIEKQTKIVEI